MIEDCFYAVMISRIVPIFEDIFVNDKSVLKRMKADRKEEKAKIITITAPLSQSPDYLPLHFRLMNKSSLQAQTEESQSLHLLIF